MQFNKNALNYENVFFGYFSFAKNEKGILISKVSRDIPEYRTYKKGSHLFFRRNMCWGRRNNIICETSEVSISGPESIKREKRGTQSVRITCFPSRLALTSKTTAFSEINKQLRFLFFSGSGKSPTGESNGIVKYNCHLRIRIYDFIFYFHFI